MEIANKSAGRARFAWLDFVVVALILATGTFVLRDEFCFVCNKNKRIQSLSIAPSHPATSRSFTAETDQTVIAVAENMDWMKVVIVPLLFEIGSVAFLQLVGVPFVSKLVWGARRLRWVPHLHLPRWTGRLVMRTNRASRLIRRVQKTVGKLYRKRSRLSIACEYTNFIGDNSSSKEAEAVARQE